MALLAERQFLNNELIFNEEKSRSFRVGNPTILMSLEVGHK